MAMSIVLETQERNYMTALAQATANADAGEVKIAHNLPAIPDVVYLEPLKAGAILSAWTVSTKSTTEVGVTKLSAVGSLDANPQLRVIAKLIHSIAR